METAIALFAYVFVSVCVGMYAHRIGHSGMGLFFLSILFSPILMFLAELARGPDRGAIERSLIRAGRRKRCLICARVVRKAARKCVHCGEEDFEEKVGEERERVPIF